MLFLTPNQEYQSTEDNFRMIIKWKVNGIHCTGIHVYYKGVLNNLVPTCHSDGQTKKFFWQDSSPLHIFLDTMKLFIDNYTPVLLTSKAPTGGCCLVALPEWPNGFFIYHLASDGKKGRCSFYARSLPVLYTSAVWDPVLYYDPIMFILLMSIPLTNNTPKHGWTCTYSQTHTHTHTQPFKGPLSWLPGWASRRWQWVTLFDPWPISQLTRDPLRFVDPLDPWPADPLSSLGPVPEGTFTHLHPSWSSDILCQLPPFTTIQSILLVQYACLTVLNNNLSPGPRLSSSRSGTLNFILHFFTQSSSFRNTCPHYHSLFAVLAMLSVLVLENLTLTLKPLTFHSRNARSIS